MKPPTIRCSVCQEFIFGLPANFKKVPTCQQCRFAQNSTRKFRRLTSKCNWRNGIAPILPALDRKRAAKPKAKEANPDAQ